MEAALVRTADRRKLDLIYFNAGGGHRATAVALDAVIKAQERPWDVRCVNLFEVLDPRDMFRGDYVTLRYDISTIPAWRTDGQSSYKRGETIYPNGKKK